jgi:hypothetical protein
MRQKIMRTQLIHPVLVALLYVAFCATEPLTPIPRCERVAIPLHLHSSKNQFEVTGSWLRIDETDGALEGNIALRNQTGKSLSRLTVIVSYFDDSGSVLFSIPYQANMANEKDEIRNIHPFSMLLLNQPVKPQDDFGLIGRNLLSISTLPISAEVVYWDAKFYEDGSGESARIGQHGFRTDALLVDTPGHLRLALPHPGERIETWLKLRINEYGRVLGVQSEREEDTSLTHEQFQALYAQLTQWHFFPGIEDGYAVQSDLSLLVEFEPENALPIKRCFLDHPDKYPSKFALVRLQPMLDSSDRWIPYYGGIPADGKIEPNIIELGLPVKPLDQ